MQLTIVRVFVSSTWLDLKPERGRVEEVLDRFKDTKFIGMERFGSHPETTRVESLREIDQCDLYLGIIGGRYGSGITEAEYESTSKRVAMLRLFQTGPAGAAGGPRRRG